MAQKTTQTVTPKKPSKSIGGEILDGVGWVLGEIFLPVPDTLIDALKKKKKAKLPEPPKQKKGSWF